MVPSAETNAAVRRFNRFYTGIVGALDEGHRHSKFSLTEVRVLFELAQRARPNVAEIGRDLRLDAGYLSRLIKDLERQGLVERTPSPSDGRQTLLSLTGDGSATVTELDARASAAIATLLANQTAAQQHQLLDAVRTIERLLGGPDTAVSKAPYLLRAHRPGDIGWVVARHGALYAQEYRWEVTFEALVARLCADFIDHFDPAREYCWIAERDGETVGCVFIVKHPERSGAAKLRMLLVEPSARGLGIGKRLVEECTRFARAAGYDTITLWTNDILDTARHLYVNEGYRLVSEEPHHSFGHDLIGQCWEKSL